MPNLPGARKRNFGPQREAQSGRRFKNPFYQTTIWRNTSREYRKANPLCEQCKKRGKVVPAYCTDHIKPINQRYAYDLENGKYGDPLNWNNLQALCEKCHAKKSGKERHL